MKIIPYIITAFISLQSFSETASTEFSTPGGQFEFLYKSKIENTGGLFCTLQSEVFNKDSNWGSAVLITIYSENDPNSTQIMYSPEWNKHIFEIRTLDTPQTYSYTSRFLSLKSSGEHVSISIKWREDGAIFYEAADNRGQSGSGYIINQMQKFGTLSVTSSGVKGNISCAPSNI
jgi:hypothetical protein